MVMFGLSACFMVLAVMFSFASYPTVQELENIRLPVVLTLVGLIVVYARWGYEELKEND